MKEVKSMEKEEKISTKTFRKFDQILGINVISTTRIKVLVSVREFISHNSIEANGNNKFYIVTPNPELVLMAQDNPELKKALNSAKLPIPDGIGLSMAAAFLSLPAPRNIVVRFIVTLFQGLSVGLAAFFNRSWLDQKLRITKGRELFIDLISLANKKGWRIFLAGGEKDEAFATAKKLMLNYKRVKFEAFAGPMLNNKAEPVSQVDRLIHFDMIQRINRFQPHLLFLAFKNPKQEIWLKNNLSRVKVGGAMAVGGTFRYIVGYSKLPPKWMAKSGLEWIWRLLTEPNRIKRVFNAWPRFPLAVWKYKLSQKSL
jgi:N-acetylglucosaminyldiphosphoundecaprenol N-acetyl-beta-D-mannosaminyltransferase